MKKQFAGVIAIMMALNLVACAPKEETTGMPNPVSEVASMEELSNQANATFIKPEGVEVSDEVFSIIDGEPRIAEYKFTVDGIECILRYADADKDVDISGIYVEEGTLYENSEADYIENDDLKSSRFFNVDGQYIFVAMDHSEMEWEKFENISEQFNYMEPKNWNFDTPFKDVAAVCGTYANEDYSQMARITLDGECVSIFVICDIDENSKTSYEMHAKVEGGKLVYDKETITKLVYPEDSYEPEETQLEDGPAGTIEIVDGKMILQNAGSDALKSIVLTKM